MKVLLSQHQWVASRYPYTDTRAITLLNALNNRYRPVGTWGQAFEHLVRGGGRDDGKTAKSSVRAAFLSIYCQEAGAKTQRRHRVRWGGGEAISLLLRLINKKAHARVDGEERKSSVRHRFQTQRASKLSAGISWECKQRGEQSRFTCLLASHPLILEPEAALPLVSNRTGLLATETQPVSHGGSRLRQQQWIITVMDALPVPPNKGWRQPEALIVFVASIFIVPWRWLEEMSQFPQLGQTVELLTALMCQHSHTTGINDNEHEWGCIPFFNSYTRRH